jgi:hypothetical protein
VDVTDQAAFVLKVILALAPLSLYFLGLGLVSSQARPCLVSARTDFTLLAVVFIPVIAFPVLALIGMGQFQMVTGTVVSLLALFFILLPRREQHWVLYNCSRAQARRLLQQASARLGWQATAHDDGSVEIQPIGLRVSQSGVPWLRSVTLHTEGPATPQVQIARRQLIAALREEFRSETMLPSPAGASLVLIGATLLGLPMWYFFHNIHAIVETVRRIFSA